VRTVEVSGNPMLENVVLIVICALLLGYLLMALLQPEKF
jgi:K+-transporting ATPase KdpF subunit